MWKDRRNHHIMISKQQPKDYDESIWYRLLYIHLNFYIVLTGAWGGVVVKALRY
jgi:hypothetical protein